MIIKTALISSTHGQSVITKKPILPHMQKDNILSTLSGNKLCLKNNLETMKNMRQLIRLSAAANLLYYNSTNINCYFLNTKITLCRKRQTWIGFLAVGASILLNTVPTSLLWSNSLPKRGLCLAGESTCLGIRKSYRPTWGVQTLHWNFINKVP